MVEISQSNLTAFNKTNVSKQSNVSRMTPNKKKPATAKVTAPPKDVKDTKEALKEAAVKPKVAKVLVAPKLAPSLPFKGMAKIGQYSYNKSSSSRVTDIKPIKTTGVSKFVAEMSSAKQ